MTDEERAVAVVKLRLAGMHPDWIKWFSREGDEFNFRYLLNLSENRNEPDVIARVYSEAPDSRMVSEYLKSLERSS